MRRLALLVGLVVVLGTSRMAHARDSLVLVCSGVARPTDDAEAVGISISYLDQRAPDGTNRRMTLRELWGDTVFKASWIGGDDSKAVAITLKAGKLVRFKGTYALEKNGDTFVMHLVGKVSRHPIDDKTLHPIDVTLPCADLSI
jgi:hypothetical protein